MLVPEDRWIGFFVLKITATRAIYALSANLNDTVVTSAESFFQSQIIVLFANIPTSL